MKRLISLALVLALCLCLAPLALAAGEKVLPSPQSFTLDGEPVVLTAYNIGGYNYVMLRHLSRILDGTDCAFSVHYDPDRNAVTIGTQGRYDPEGEETAIGFAELDENGRVTNAVRSSQSVRIDGGLCTLDAWNIGGNNYFRLSELQEYLGFGLSYDPITDTAKIQSSPLVLSKPDVKTAANYAEVREHLGNSVYYGGVKRAGGSGAAEPEEAPAAVNTTTSAASDSAVRGLGGGDEIIGTNVQVAGVDEGDIVKTDGTYIYVLNEVEELTILKAEGADTKVLSRTSVGFSESSEAEDGKRWSSTWLSPEEMYVSDGRLVILSGYSSYLRYEDGDVWQWEDESNYRVTIFDVSDPAAPKQLTELGQDGYLLSSRLVDGKLYVVTNRWIYNYDEDQPVTYLPILYRDGVKTVMPANRIAICGSGGEEYVIVCVYDLASASLRDSMSLLGSGDQLYMTPESLYVMGNVWEAEELESTTESVYQVTSMRRSRNTNVFRFDLTDGLKLAASVTVPGYLDDQFSADEYQGQFRIVTTCSESRYKIYEDPDYDFVNYRWEDTEPSSGLYILDRELNLLGAVTDLAPGERVYSARFDGDIGYFTTFRNVDPLFTVDLSDPTAPKVLSSLKISGFSEYLHAWGAGRLFGFGREADEEDGWAEELKMVMFNTEDKTAVFAEHTLTLGDSYSEALYDHKSFFISADRNVIGFPSDSGYCIYSYDAAQGFRLLASLDLDAWRMRGLSIGNAAYIVSQDQITVLDMQNWSVLATVPLTE